MRLRILHVTPYSEAAWAYGGIPRVVGALTRSLAKRGHSVTVCATDVCDAGRRLPQTTRSQNLSGRPQSRTGTDGVAQNIFRNISNRLAYHQLYLPLGMRDYLRRHAADFDIAHLHGCRNLPTLIASHHLARAGVPYVVQPNGTAAIIERRHTAKRLFDFVERRRVLTRAASVLAVSHSERQQLIELGVAPGSIHVIGNPIDLSEFSPPISRGCFRRAWNIGSSPMVFFLGKITPRKNVDTLVHAFARSVYRDARLVIAGNDMGGGALAREIATELGVNNRTTFTGLL